MVVRPFNSFHYTNTDTFVQIPLTNPYPGPQSVLVLDNCNIHHADEVRELVEVEARMSSLCHEVHTLTCVLGCRIIYLPPYSPNYNPIELAFSSIKSYLRRHSHDRGLFTVVSAMDTITPEKAAGWFRSSGYM